MDAQASHLTSKLPQESDGPPLMAKVFMKSLETNITVVLSLEQKQFITTNYSLTKLSEKELKRSEFEVSSIPSYQQKTTTMSHPKTTTTSHPKTTTTSHPKTTTTSHPKTTTTSHPKTTNTPHSETTNTPHSEATNTPHSETTNTVHYTTIMPHHKITQRLKRQADITLSHLDICASESFEAHCPLDHVIFVKSALYGRIEESRCVSNFLDQVGCYSNVILLMDRGCSGKRACEIHVPNAELESTNPCLKELKSFLRFNYECVPGWFAFCDLF